VKNWLNLFIDYHNKELGVVKWTGPCWGWFVWFIIFTTVIINICIYILFYFYFILLSEDNSILNLFFSTYAVSGYYHSL
jgi:hypothetical protein